jgi:hypothetical protein
MPLHKPCMQQGFAAKAESLLARRVFMNREIEPV